MNIPDKAVEAAARFLFSRDAASSGVLRTWEQIPEASRRHYIADAHIGLETAAPFIAAQALREQAEKIRNLWPTPQELGVVVFLDAQADDLEAGE